MPQRKPDKTTTLDQILKLVEKLAPEDQAQLRHKLDQSWGERWDTLVQKVEKQSKGLPPLSEEDVADEVMAYRTEKRAQSA